jgi:hypothetical protein
MSQSSAMNASIEGEKLSLQTRKFFHYPPKKDSITKTRYWGFSLSINGQAEIYESYLKPKEVCKYTTSMFCVGDKIAGASVSGWALKPLGHPHISKGSGAHSASFLSIAGGCLAMVEISPREHLQSKDFQDRNPPITPELRISTQSSIAVP